MPDTDPIYITTAIDYPNSVPHLGHAYEKTVADFYTRWYRRRGRRTRFLTGLDEHGQKIQDAADRAGLSARAFVDEKASAFTDLCERLEISNDDFIRTSSERHHRYARELWSTIAEKGAIYLGDYEGIYCVPCEAFVTETQLKAGVCAEYTKPGDIIPIKEESYFFRLSEYREWIRDHIRANPEFVFPAERRNEILSRLDDEVRDLSISRSTFRWGVPVPGDDRHVMYVWFDALSNYISALKEPEDVLDTFWPADMHVVGKDIIWFHAVIWPCMLHVAGLPLPRQIYVHGFILDDQGRKMSKTLQNVVDPLEVAERLGPEVLRFYLLKAFSSGQDGRFSVADLEQRYRGELGNDLGNLVMRVAKLVSGKLGGELPRPAGCEAALDFAATVRDFEDQVEAREHHRALETLWSYIRQTNAYLNDQAPWKSDDGGVVERVLYNALEALRAVAYLLEPAMPRVAAAIEEQIGVTIEPGPLAPFGSGVFRVKLASPLFPRLDDGGGKKPEGKKGKKSPAAKSGPGKGDPAEFDPFARLDLRVARIDEVEDHPDADALYVLRVRLGEGDEGEVRTICAGLRKHLEPADLRGRKVVVLANLKPARLRGVESQGMILASDAAGGGVVPIDPGDAPVGETVEVEGIERRPKTKLSSRHFGQAPLTVKQGEVTYSGRPLRTSAGPITCAAPDGAPVR